MTDKRRDSEEEVAAEQLLQSALSQPGVRELVEVYEAWKAVEAVAAPQRQLMGVKRTVSVSSSSGPVVRPVTS